MNLNLRRTMFSLVVFSFLTILVSANFTFTNSQLQECEPITITWQGGTPPYSLFVTPIDNFDNPINISSISSNTSTDNNYSFSTTLPFDNGTSFLLTMSDSTGFGSGGTSPLLTPAFTGDNSCQNEAPPPPDFSFSLPDSLTQCEYVCLLEIMFRSNHIHQTIARIHLQIIAERYSR